MPRRNRMVRGGLSAIVAHVAGVAYVAAGDVVDVWAGMSWSGKAESAVPLAVRFLLVGVLDFPVGRGILSLDEVPT